MRRGSGVRSEKVGFFNLFLIVPTFLGAKYLEGKWEPYRSDEKG